MQYVFVGPLKINPLTKQEFLLEVEDRLNTLKPTWVTTVNSEFLLAALKDEKIATILNQANISICDGVGVLWFNYYQSLKFDFKNTFIRYIIEFILLIYSLALICVQSKKIFSFPKIVGADVFMDLIDLFDKLEKNVFLFGNYGDAAVNTKNLLEKRFKKIHLVGTSNGNAEDENILNEIKQKNTECLFVGFGPIKQEKFINNNMQSLNLKFACGVGGTFEYMSGKYLTPPSIIRESGFEWLFRFITQAFKPGRFKRVIAATFGLMYQAYIYKLKRIY